MAERITNRKKIVRINSLSGKPMTVVSGEVETLTGIPPIGSVIPPERRSPGVKEALKGHVVNVNKTQSK